MIKSPINEKIAWVIDQLMLRRKELGISHEKLAQRAKISRGAIGFIEKKQRIPTIATLFKICDVLDISLGKIILEYERDH